MTEHNHYNGTLTELWNNHNARESRHMQMGALVSYQLEYPDMTIRDFFRMALPRYQEDN